MNQARRHRGIVTGSIATALLIVMIYGTMRCARSIIAHAPISVSDDALLSDSHRTALATDLTHGIHTAGPAYTVAHYTHYSPILDTLTIRYRYPLHGMVDYQIKLPVAQLNHTIALLPDGTLVPAQLFEPSFVASVTPIHIHNTLLQHSQAPSTLTALATTLPPCIVERFTCTWKDNNTCYYHDQLHTDYTLVCNGTIPPQENELVAYNAILQQHKPDRAHAQWIVDVRFKNQVVVSPDGGLYL